MQNSDPVFRDDTPEPSERAVRNLTEQVRHLELILLARHAEWQADAERAAMFEAAAIERLAVIERADTLLREQADSIAELRRQATELRQKADTLTHDLEATSIRHGEERQREERARRESGRCMEELATRERSLLRENLELRNEGLIHSVIRRIRSLFS